MAKKISYNKILNKSEDWGLDVNNGYPFSGQSVQDYIKAQFEEKAGEFYYDVTNNRYLVFADSENRDLYLEDPSKTDLLIGTFDAPFNYSAEISLSTPTYNAVFLGTTGNYIDFTFDIKNKQNASTGENVTVTYTFIRNATKQVITETRRFGESVHFNVDEYLLEGTNTVIVGVTGQSTLAATTVAVTYQVVSLSLTDSMNISTVYDLSAGSQTINVPYTVKGQGTKIIEWFLDGEQLEYVRVEDEIADSSADKIKPIVIDNLSSGVHNLQFRAYTVIGGENFYTDTLYREFMVNNGDSNDVYVAVKSTIPYEHGIVTIDNPFIFYGIEQYLPYNLIFATSKKAEVEIKLGDTSLAVLTTSSNEEIEYIITTSSVDNTTLSLIVNGIPRDINTSVDSTTLDIQELTENLEFDFRASGMSNTATNKDSWSYGSYTGTFSGFKWNNLSGWVDGALLLGEDDEFSVNYTPLSADATSTGKTLEFEFAARNVENDDAIICDLRNTDGTGLLITASEARLISKVGKVVYTKFKAGERNRISFVINRSSNVTNKGLVFIYVNGILSGAINYGTADNYIANTNISFKGSSEVWVELYSIRIYNTALTSSQILNNYILYRTSIDEMRTIYDRNDILEDGKISLDKARRRLPVMIITGDILELDERSDTSYYVTVDIVYYNDQDPSKNFTIKDARIRIQGTSSRFYPRKNYRFYTNKAEYTVLYDANGNIVEDGLYAFKDNSQPVDCWCLKADFAESSGTHNTGVARIWNEVMTNTSFSHTNILGETVEGYPLRTSAQIQAKAAGYDKDVRTTIDGFPILVFRRETEADDLVFLGKYNFNNDKSTPSVFGFEDIPNFDNSKMQSWEFLENEDVIALFQTVDGFYDSVVDDEGETKQRWELAFEARYEGPNASIDDLYTFAQWVVSMNNNPIAFATEKWAHLDVYKVAAYYCYLMRFGALDQVVKNCFATSEDGIHYYFINYDNDTINGVDNTGEISASPDVDRTSVYENGSYVYAGHNSVLWNMLENDTEFMNIVKIVDEALYSAGLTYKNVIEMFNDKQSDKWVERVYNEDSQYKYITPYTDKNISYLSSLQGSRKSHRKWWLSKRFSLYDSMYATGDFTAKAIEIKCQSGTPSGMNIGITAGTKMNYGYGLNRVPREVGVALNVDDSHTFTLDTELGIGTPVAIYAGPHIKSLNISSFAPYINTFNIGNVYDSELGTKLKTLVMGDGVSTNINVNAISGISSAKRLQELDIRGFKGITELDLSEQDEFKTLKAVGSGLASVTFSKGAPVTRVELPASMLQLNFEQLPYLSTNNIILENGFSKIEKMTISGCPNISNNFEFIYNWYNTKTIENKYTSLIVDNVDWNNLSADQLIEIGNIKLDGGNLILKGKAKLSDITLEQVESLQAIFGVDSFKKASNPDFLIDAPASIFITGRTSILEGETEKYETVVFGEEIDEIRWTLVTSSSYVTLDSEGLLTVTEGIGNSSITIRVQVIQGYTVTNKDLVITVNKRIYPTSSQFSISGPSVIKDDVYTANYIVDYTISNITGEMIYEWTLDTVFDGLLEVVSNGDSCTVTKVGETIMTQGNLSLTIRKKHNNSSIGTNTLSISVVNDTIAETDIGVVTALYNAGLCANPNYITKLEAALVTDAQLQSGSSYTTSIFYAQRSKIKTFDGLQYFTGLTSIPNYCFSYCSNLTSVKFPPQITSIGECAFYYNSTTHAQLQNLIIPHGVTSIGNYAFNKIETLTGNLIIPDSVTSIGYSAFNNTNFIGNLVIPDSVTSIGSSAFMYTKFETIHIGTGLTKLNYNVFGYMESLSKITGAINVTEVDPDAFSGFDFNAIIDIAESVPFGLVYSIYKVRRIQNGYTSGYIYNGVTAMLGSMVVEVEDSKAYFDNNRTVQKSITIEYTGGIENIDDKVSVIYGDFIIESNKSDAEFQLNYINSDGILTTEIVGVGTHLIYGKKGCSITIIPTQYDNYVVTEKVGNIYSSVVIDYFETVNLYIQHIDGQLYTSEEWTTGGYSNDSANGVAVIRVLSGGFVIAKENASTSTLAWGGYDINATNLYSDKYIAEKNNDGIGNTTKIINKLTGVTDSQNVIGAPAAEACANYVFPNGLTGYLGTLGEWKHVNYNKNDIVNLMNQIEGDNFSSIEYWTSIQSDIYSAWSSRFYKYNKRQKFSVRAFSAPWALTINCNTHVGFQVIYTRYDGVSKTITLEPGIHYTVIPQLNTSVTISVASGYEWAEVNVPTQTFVYNGSPITATFVAGVEPGVYIQHVDGTLYTTAEWTNNEYGNDVANGVAVVSSTESFVIAKENASTSTLAWGGYNKEVNGIVTSTTYDNAVLDFSGKENTTKIIEQLKDYTDDEGITGAPAAEVAVSYTFPNNNNGYLPSLGEWRTVYNNRVAIDEAMSLIGGSIDYYTWHWSSTQSSPSASWSVYLSTFRYEKPSKAQNRAVRSFSVI